MHHSFSILVDWVGTSRRMNVKIPTIFWAPTTTDWQKSFPSSRWCHPCLTFVLHLPHEFLQLLVPSQLWLVHKFWQFFIQLWINDERAIGLQTECGLILVERKHPLYNIYGLFWSNNLSSTILKSKKRNPQLAIFWTCFRSFCQPFLEAPTVC
jgi:hypothetical protein